MSRGGYDFYLNKCLLPVTPQKLQLNISNANKTVVLIDEGQINILKRAGLTDIEFECCIPQIRYPFATYKSGFVGASYFLDYFEELKTSKKPFQFIVSRTLPNGIPLFSTNIKVAMEDYSITEDAKQGFDLTVKIKLRQYRQYGTKTVTISVPAATEESSAADTSAAEETPKPEATVEQPREAENSPAPASPQTYTVKKGDCLFNIAKKYYGNGNLYNKIASANSDKIKNPNLIYPGQVLTIPAA